jgi:hypothetical protein
MSENRIVFEPIEKIATNNNIKSRFWIFELDSRIEYTLVFPFDEKIKLVLERIRNNKKWARVMWVELPPNSMLLS